jgi:hypothetical protein
VESILQADINASDLKAVSGVIHPVTAITESVNKTAKKTNYLSFWAIAKDEPITVRYRR